MRRTFSTVYLLLLAVAVGDYLIRLPCLAEATVQEVGLVILCSSVPALMAASVVLMAGDLFWIVCMPLAVWGIVSSCMEWLFRVYLVDRNIVGERLMVTLVTLNWEKVRDFAFSGLSLPHQLALLAAAALTLSVACWLASRQVGSPTMRTLAVGGALFAGLSFFLPHVLQHDHLVRALADHAYLNSLDGTSLYCELSEGGEPLERGTYRTSESNLLAVVVIGESSTRADWSLYGYSRKTTPNLDAMSSRLVVFSDVTADSCLTPYALRDLFTWNAEGRTQSLPSAAVSAGYDGILLSTQPRFGFYDGADELLFSTCRREYLREKVSPDRPCYDDALIPCLRETIRTASSASNRLVFVHTYGSHCDWSDQYPDSFVRFSADFVDAESRGLDASKRRSLNAYDNSIVFTDHVVSELLRTAMAAEGPVVFVYISDHGESPRSSGRNQHHPDTRAIPFFVWMSDDFRAARPSLSARLRADKDKALTARALRGLWLELLGLE